MSGRERQQNLNKSLVLPALLSGAAVGNRAHRYNGKVCCLLLGQADYIRQHPWARPRGHGELLKRLCSGSDVELLIGHSGKEEQRESRVACVTTVLCHPQICTK